MSIFDIFKRQPQNKSINHPAQLQAFLDAYGGREVLSGVTVTAESAMTVPAINRGVHLMADMVAMLPLMIYKRLEQGKERAKDHEQYYMIHDRPNEFQSAYQFRYTMQRHLILRGNAYAFKTRASGFLKRLQPIHPNRVVVEQDDDFNVNYKVTMPSGIQKDFKPRDILHLRPHTEDGFTGMGIIDEAPESIAMCIAAERHGAMLFGNGVRPGGILSTDQKIGPEQMQKIAESWKSAFGGDNKYSTAVLDGGMKWDSTGMSNEDAQYLEIRSFQVAEAARLIGIPPILLFHSDTASTFASAKELVLSFLKFSLDPWLTYWEMEYNQNILNQDNGKYFVEFIRQGIEKMDIQTQMQAYSSMIQNEIANPNEIRAFLNMNPYEGGDRYRNPNTAQDDRNTGGKNEE